MNNSPVITYEKHGGMRNFKDKYEIYQDGTVFTDTLMGGRIAHSRSYLPEKELKGILDLFDKNNFFSMGDSYSPECEPKLPMMQKLTYNFQGKNKTVTATNGGNPPKEFWNIVEGLEAMVK